MKKQISMKSILAGLIMLVLVSFTSCTNEGQNAVLQATIDSLENELQQFRDEQAITELRLAKFDTLDFEYYSNQEWEKFAHNHADDVKAYYPDGSVTTGLFPQHIDQLAPMFKFAPDTKIKEHPVRFGSGDWTAVIGTLEGTFSAPMPIGEGKTIPPTGKKFKLSMVTIGRWGADGKMTEEYLFWDNLSFMKQIGLAQ